MKRHVVLFLLSVCYLSLLLPLTATAQADLAAAWSGNFMFSAGEDSLPAGVEISAMNDWNQLMWLINGEATASGVGLPMSETQLAVAADVTCVIQIFNIGADGTLSGPWAWSFTGIGEETSTPTEGQSEVGGLYHSVGAYPDGTAYEGDLEIASVGDNVYNLTWSFEDGTSYSGVGMISGDQMLAAADTDPAINCTVGVLTKNDDGSVQWDWALENTSTSVTSVVGSPVVLAEQYTIAGVLTSDNTEYTGVVSVAPGGSSERQGIGFTFGTDTQSDLIAAVGLLRGNALMFVYGGEQCGAVSHALMSDGRLATHTTGFTATEVGSTVQTPDGAAAGLDSTFVLGNPDVTGTFTFSQVTDEVYSSTGQAAMGDATASLDGLYLRINGLLSGVVALTGDVSQCSVQTGIVDTDGTIYMMYARYGSTDIEGRETLTPAG